MPNTNEIAQYQKWFSYEQEAHHQTVASFETVPLAQRTDPRFQQAIDLLAHVMAARGLWLHRFGIAPTGPVSYDELFPAGTSMDALEAAMHHMHTTWSTYLGDLDEAELNRVFTYHSHEGPAYQNAVRDLLAQLSGHSWYHRGQIALLVRQLGGTPAQTDYVFWSRHELA